MRSELGRKQDNISAILSLWPITSWATSYTCGNTASNEPCSFAVVVIRPCLSVGFRVLSRRPRPRLPVSRQWSFEIRGVKYVPRTHVRVIVLLCCLVL